MRSPGLGMLGLLWVALLAAPAPAGPRPRDEKPPAEVPRAACCERAKAVQAHLYALAAVRDRLRGELEEAVRRDGAAGARRTVALVIPAALPGHYGSMAPLAVELYWCGGGWLGAVQTGRGAPVVVNVDPSGLALTDTSLAGTLKATVQWSEGGFHLHAVRAFQIQATVAGGKIAGRATSGRLGFSCPACAGAVSGTVTGAAPPELVNLPPREGLDGRERDHLYASAKWFEDDAARVFREILALDAAIGNRVGFAEAYRHARFLQPPRPAPTVHKDPMKALAGEGADPAGPAGPDGQAPDDPLAGAALLLGGRGRAVTKSAGVLRRERDWFDAMGRMADRLGRWAGLAGRMGAAPPGAADVTVGGVEVGDPDFGPYYVDAGSPALPAGADDANVLPASSGAAGRQRWQHVGRWRILGPFAGDGRLLPARRLPEIAEDADETFVRADARGLGGLGGDGQIGWQAAWVEAATGRVRPPVWNPGEKTNPEDDAGLVGGCFYAAADVHAEVDCRLWLAVGVNDYGKLWVNDRLVWTSPPTRDVMAVESVSCFQADFRRGTNRLLFRCDNDEGAQHFWLRVCTRGRPRGADQVRARDEAVRKAKAAMTSPVAGVTGWRRDWTGRYPEADPVTAWDIAQGINVVWKVPMPWCFSTPVIAGEKIFTQVEPHTLVCMDKRTGRTLWRRDSDIMELLGKGDESRRLKAVQDEAERQLEAIPGRGAAKVDALVAAGLARPAAEKKYQELADRARVWTSLLAKHNVRVVSGWGYWYGMTFPTPVTDGRHIWVKYGTGVAACYDLDGGRRWLANVGGATLSHRLCPSPILLGGKLILELPVVEGGKSKLGAADTVVIGLDAATGRKLWSAPGTNPNWCGSPVPVRLTDGRDTMDVVVTAGGNVIRADDGKVLVADVGAHSCADSPIAVDDVVYFRPVHRKIAVKLIMVSRDQVGAKKLWDRRCIGQQIPGGLVYDDGCLYGVRERTQNIQAVDVIDAATGRRLRAKERILWTKPGRAYVPIALAGKCLFVADDGRWFFYKRRDRPGGWSVLQRGLDGMVLARNRMIGDTQAAPVFDGDRVYVRTTESFLCLGRTGEKGRIYEAQVNAYTLLTEIFPDRPADTAPLLVRPLAALRRPHMWVFGYKRIPRNWLYAGPLALAGADEALASLGGPTKARAGAEAKVTCLGRSVGFVPVDPERAKMWAAMIDPVDVVAVTGARADSVTYFQADLLVDQERIVRLQLDTPGARAWLDGVAVGHNQRLRLLEGTYSLLVEVRVGQFPPGGLSLSPQLWWSQDPKEELRQWRQAVGPNRHYFERAIRLAPNSETARRAKRLLDSFADAD